MANIKSQIKRNKQNEKQRLRNKAVKSELKTRVKNTVEIAKSPEGDTTSLLALAIKRLDKAASKGVIHKNQAARRKSRLIKKVKGLQSSNDG